MWMCECLCICVENGDDICKRLSRKICHHRQIQTGSIYMWTLCVCWMWKGTHHRLQLPQPNLHIILYDSHKNTYDTHNLNENEKIKANRYMVIRLIHSHTSNQHPSDTCNLWQINVKICHNSYESFKFDMNEGSEKSLKVLKIVYVYLILCLIFR